MVKPARRPEAEIVHRAFSPRDLIAGHVVLDFANTVNGRDARPSDWLDGYARLLQWAALTGAFRRETLSFLRREGRENQRGARRELASARSLREALFGILSALARGDSAPPAALTSLERRWKRSVSAATLNDTSRGFAPVLRAERVGLETVSSQIALWAVALLCELPNPRMRICEGSDCSWLFLDTSKSGRRRWCDMATCGNVSKARRHSERHKMRQHR
jgi:predicted RNA-binding Zn ribbon-like protein